MRRDAWAGWVGVGLGCALAACDRSGPPPIDPCAATEDCRRLGACTADPGGRCVAASWVDCGRSQACRLSGACDLVGDVCAATDTEDCRRSRGCSSSGACALRDGLCETTPEGCARSGECSSFGLCRLAQTPSGPGCVALGDEDCKDSLLCKGDGACVAFEGECRHPSALP